MPPFSLLIKPAGADCNLRCPYCFYSSRLALHGGARPRMDDATLARTLADYLALPLPAHSVCFQGGEPTLMGEEFFERAAELGEGIEFSMQTNATLITRRMARFLADAGWLVGVSPHGGGTDFRRGYERLREAGAEICALALVTSRNVDKPERMYAFLRDDLRCTRQQYIECTAPAQFAVSGEEWGEFMVRLFDEWMRRGDLRRVSVRTFDSIAAEIATGRPTLCQFSGDCRHHLVVEANGDVYPCDFHVEPRFRLGNVMEEGLEAIASSVAYREFGARKRGHADCPRNAHALDAGWRRLYAHAVPVLRELVPKQRV